jgi:hypothetical protein
VRTVRLVNLTPHELNIYDSEGKVILSIPPPKDIPIPRVSIKSEVVGKINVYGVEVPIRKVMYSDVENLPPPEEGTIYVVSTFVTLALRDKGIERRDLLSPDTNVDSII